MDRDEIDQRMAEADQELAQMACEALDRCLQAGAKPDDLKLLAWQAGVANIWKPTENRRAA